jgi:hypothetical protein
MINPSPPAEEEAPVRVALQRISEARRILEAVVTSSESFDYPKAKEGLKELQRMIRDLAREEARFRANSAPVVQRGSAKVLPFPGEQAG